jgi:hypothetical protein
VERHLKNFGLKGAYDFLLPAVIPAYRRQACPPLVIPAQRRIAGRAEQESPWECHNSQKKRDRHDSRMTRMPTPHVIPSQGWAVRLIEKVSRGRKLTELPKK